MNYEILTNPQSVACGKAAYLSFYGASEATGPRWQDQCDAIKVLWCEAAKAAITKHLDLNLEALPAKVLA